MIRIKFITHRHLIRSARNANIPFRAVAPRLLSLVARRLDEAERFRARSGCIYVWEEHNTSHSQFNCQEMRRFTEGEADPSSSLSAPDPVPRSRQSSHPFHKAEVEIHSRPEAYNHRFWFPCPSFSFFAVAPGSITDLSDRTEGIWYITAREATDSGDRKNWNPIRKRCKIDAKSAGWGTRKHPNTTGIHSGIW